MPARRRWAAIDAPRLSLVCGREIARRKRWRIYFAEVCGAGGANPGGAFAHG